MQALSIQNLTKTYDQDVQALRGINLDVAEGDFFALLGPNGAGKSTAIGIISSLVNKTSGSVQVFEHDLDKEPERIKASIGLVPQEFNFNSFDTVLNIVTNIAGYNGIGMRESRRRAEHYLTRLDLWEKRNTAARALSGGMKRRLMIARALVHEPRLLILDEPTAGVDIEIRRSMWEYLSSINSEEGITIMLTTHYLEEAEALCKNVAIIDHGDIIERGAVSELLSRSMQETFVLDIQDALHELPQVQPFLIRTCKDPLQIEVEVPKGHKINDLFDGLSSLGIAVNSMRNKSNRLEEFFVRLVNQSGGREELDTSVLQGTPAENGKNNTAT